MKVALTLFGVLSLVFAQTFPTLPTSYSVDMEANYLDMGQTRNLREYNDATAGLRRIEVNNADSSTITFIDYNKQVQYVSVNNLNCGPQPIPAADPISGAHTLQDMFTFATLYANVTTYTGNTTTVRGISCNQWTSTYSLTSNGTVHYVSISYFFTIPTWRFASMNVTGKPVRIIVNATRVNGNFTVGSISHYYEIINFIPSPPAPATFYLPAVCLNVAGNVVNLLYQPAGQGLAAGMFFLGAFIGALVACVSIWGYCRRRQQQREKFNRTNMEMTKRDDE